MEKNYLIRRTELLSRVRRLVHNPTRAEKNVKAYSRKVKHRKLPSDD